jgi:hypothetical protein
VPGVDRTRRHPTCRPPGHRVPDLCNHPRSFAPGLLLLPQSSSLYAMSHQSPAHHETSERDSPNETKVKEKQNKTIPDLNSNIAKSMIHHNQTNELTTWFLREKLGGRPAHQSAIVLWIVSGAFFLESSRVRPTLLGQRGRLPCTGTARRKRTCGIFGSVKEAYMLCISDFPLARCTLIQIATTLGYE